MSEKSSPRPGEIWRYECPLIGDRVGVVGATGRATVIDGDNAIPKTARPVELIGYTAGYVELRGFGLEGDWSKLSRELHAAEALADRRAQQRDVARARAEKAEAELKAERETVRAPGLDDIARDEPWRVLRAAASLMGEGAQWSAQLLRVYADRLEREHAKKSRRGQLIEKAREAFKAESGIDTTPVDGWVEAVVDAVLAEAGDPQ